MEFKGTKGKWKSVNLGSHWNNKDIDNIQIQYGEDGECVSDHVYCEYDALLISKAPELLDFIQSFVQSFESDYVVDGEIVDNPYEWLIQEYEKAKKLIKQATTLQNDQTT